MILHFQKNLLRLICDCSKVILLDEYVYGTHVSPEARVVVKHENTERKLGGAGNVYNNIKSPQMM